MANQSIKIQLQLEAAEAQRSITTFNQLLDEMASSSIKTSEGLSKISAAAQEVGRARRQMGETAARPYADNLLQAQFLHDSTDAIKAQHAALMVSQNGVSNWTRAAQFAGTATVDLGGKLRDQASLWTGVGKAAREAREAVQAAAQAEHESSRRVVFSGPVSFHAASAPAGTSQLLADQARAQGASMVGPTQDNTPWEHEGTLTTVGRLLDPTKAFGGVASAISSAVGSAYNWIRAGEQSRAATRAAAQANEEYKTSVEARTAAENIGTASVQSSISAFDVFKASLAAIGISVTVAGLVAGFKALAFAVSDAATKQEALTAQLTAQSGSGDRANQVLKDSFALSQKLGLETTNLAEAYIKFAAATKLTTIGATDTSRMVESLATASIHAGLSQESMNQVFSLAGGFLGKATLSLADLLSLERALPGSFETSARAMKTSTEGLADLANQGKVLTELFLPRFAEQVRRDLGDATVEGVNRGVSGIQSFKNEWNALLVELGGSGRGLKDTLGDVGADWLRALRGMVGTTQQALHAGAQAMLADLEATASKTRLFVPGLGVVAGTTHGATPAEQQELERLKSERERVGRGPQKGWGPAAAWDQIKYYSNPANLFTSPLKDEERRHALDMQQRAILDTIAKRNTITPSVGTVPSGQQDETARATEEAMRAEIVANKQLQDTLNTSKTAIETLNKSAALTPEVFGKSGTRIDEAAKHIEYYSRTISTLRSQLEEITKVQLRRPDEAGPEPAGLVAQKAQLERSLREAVANKSAIEKAVSEAEAAKRKAEQEAQAAIRRAQQAALEQEQGVWANDMRRQSEAGAAFDQLSKLAAKYTETKSARDADTASKLAASVAGYKEYAATSQALAAQVAWGESLQALMQKESAAAEARYQIAQKAKGDLGHYEELLGMANGLKITPEQRQYVKAQEALQGKGLDQARVDAVLSQLEPSYVKAQKVAGQFGDFLVATLEEIATAGKVNFASLLTSFERLLISAVLDLSGTRQAVSGLAKQGIDWIGTFFKGGAPTANAAQYGSPIGPTMEGAPMASGGFTNPSMPEAFHLVGENGPEMVKLPGGSRVYAHGEGPGGTVNHFNMVVYAKDAGSFQRDRGAIDSHLIALIRKAQRNA